MTLGHRIELLLVAFFVLLALNAAVAIGDLRARDEALARAARLEPARILANELTAHMVDQETGQRGFLLTGDEQFLGPYDAGTVAARSTIAQLRSLYAGDEEVTEVVDRVEDSWERWRAEAAEPELAASRAGGDVDELVGARTGQRLFDLLRADIGALRDVVGRREATLDGDLEQLRDRLSTTLFVSFFLGLALLVSAAILLRRWITAPFAVLSAAVRRVAAGDLDHPIPLAGPSDLAALGADVEGMRRRIVAQIADEVRAREALEQQGPAVVTLRAQLAPSRAALPDQLRVAGRLVPAEGVLAGDWYDVLVLADGRVVLIIVDVSGHGPVAGVFALRAKLLLVAALCDGRAPGDALGWLAAQLGDTGETFLTGLVVEVDGDSGRGRYANAGHPPALLSTDRGVTRLGPTGPLLGPWPGRWETVSFMLPDAGVLVGYTDGIIEARAGHGLDGEFGVGGLLRLVAASDDGCPKALVDRCVEAVEGFADGRLADDATVVALARRSTSDAAHRPVGPSRRPRRAAVA